MCNQKGSRSHNCDLITGKCECQSSMYGGDQCEHCAENYYNYTLGCQPCEECYSLVQNKVSNIRQRIETVEKNLQSIISITMTDTSRKIGLELDKNIKRIENEVNEFHSLFFEKSNYLIFNLILIVKTFTG